MERLKHGCMIVWDRELIMMLLDVGVQQWHIVLMELGNMASSSTWSGLSPLI